MNDILVGLQTKNLIKGVLRCSRSNQNDCYIIAHMGADGERLSVKIQGRDRVNRAIDGDVVAIELMDNPGDFQHELDSVVALDQGVKVAEETAEASLESLEGISSPVSTSKL